MTHFDGYTVPLLSPDELLEFSEETGSYINFDTTHYAQEGGDIAQAAAILKRRIRLLHLSDYGERGAHLFPGEGMLDLQSFFRELDRDSLYAVTVECNSVGGSTDETRLAERYAGAREYVETLIGS
jgi:sugar phosphate isomerase/epimerase